MRESCRWQTLGFIRQTKGKSPTVPMNVKQKLILCVWGGKYRKYIRDVKVIPWVQDGGRRSG